MHFSSNEPYVLGLRFGGSGLTAGYRDAVCQIGEKKITHQMSGMAQATGSSGLTAGYRHAAQD